MKKYLLLFAVLIAAMNVKAYDVNYAGCYKSVKIEFQTLDENNQPITISELVTFPLEKDRATKREVGFFVLSCMPFNMDSDKSATGDAPFDANLLRTIATEGAMTVQLDGQGFGASAGHCIPFLGNKINARQSIDGLFAAMEYAKANGIKVSDNYYTINTGYSLDGGRSIAIQRYLEKYATDEERARFRLRRTISGGAPICATEMARLVIPKYAKNYPELIAGFFKANKEGALHAYEVEDFFDADGNIRSDVYDATSPVGKAFWKVASSEDMNEDWVPETPITMIHYADDEVVSFTNAQIALDAWGPEKFKVLDKNLAGKKWNVSLLKTAFDMSNDVLSTGAHAKGAAAFYAGMVDGCLRDTVIADTYGQDMNFYKMLTMVFDVTQNLKTEIPINLGTSVQGGKLIIKSLSNLNIQLTIIGDDGKEKAKVNATISPEAKDSLATAITDVDAKGYLHLPVEFEAEVYGIPITGTVKDLYTLIENLSAIVLHHYCNTKEEAQKYCDAINQGMDIKANVLFITGTLIASYTEVTGDDGVVRYKIEPDLMVGDVPFGVVGLLRSLGVVDLDTVLTINNRSFNIAGYTASFHVTEENFGEVKFYADITDANGTAFGRADFDLTGVDMNADGTQQTFKIGLDVALATLPLKVTGTVYNLNDAVLAAILCYNNLSCQSAAQAQAYADAVNKTLDLKLLVKTVSDDGTYADDAPYTDYGPVRACVAKADDGTYSVQLCMNWMGTADLPLWSVIKEYILNK